MANIVIDPVIIVTPADGATRAEVEAWMENLSRWLKEALTAPFTWLHYREASELLESQGQFPSFGQLKKWQRKYHLDINITEIARDVNAFFRDDTLIADGIDLWAKGEHGILYAIKQQNKKVWPDAVTSSFTFRLGPHFIKSVNERGLDTNEIVLRSIIRAASDVIADRAKDIPSYRLHPYRKSETADSPQLVRDSDHARAWRLMLQKHGAGWRLHYWQIPTPKGSMIEFANVCKESEREIY